MTKPIEMNVIGQTDCSFDATFKVPAGGGLLICAAKGKNASNGNWTSITVIVTEINTGATYLTNAQSDSAFVQTYYPIRNAGSYKVHAVQNNFRETCESTLVSGRTLDPSFLA